MTNLAIEVFSIVGLPASSLFTAIDLKIQEHIDKKDSDLTAQQENQTGLINCNNVNVFLNVAAAIASVALITTMNKEDELVNTSVITAFTTLAKLCACYSKNQMLPQEAKIAESSYAFAMAITAGIASSIPFFNDNNIKLIGIISAIDMAISALRPSVDNYTAQKVAEQKLNAGNQNLSETSFNEHSTILQSSADLEKGSEEKTNNTNQNHHPSSTLSNPTSTNNSSKGNQLLIT